MKKTNFISLLVIGIFLASILSIAFVSASFPCYTSTSKIGLIKAVNDYRDREIKAVEIEKTYNFWESVRDGNRFSIDKYTDLVQDFVGGRISRGSNLQEAEIKNEFSKNVYIMKNTERFYSVGDIVIEGPPTHSCGPAFNAVYSSDGQIKYSHTRSYEDFLKDGVLIRTNPAEEISCFGSKCGVFVDFEVDGEEFKIRPGQVYYLKYSEVVKAVYLFEAKKPSSTAPSYDTMDWGAIRYADYVVEFYPDEEEKEEVIIDEADEKTYANEDANTEDDDNEVKTPISDSKKDSGSVKVSIEIPNFVWWIAGVIVVLFIVSMIARRKKKSDNKEL